MVFMILICTLGILNEIMHFLLSFKNFLSKLINNSLIINILINSMKKESYFLFCRGVCVPGIFKYFNTTISIQKLFTYLFSHFKISAIEVFKRIRNTSTPVLASCLQDPPFLNGKNSSKYGFRTKKVSFLF